MRFVIAMLLLVGCNREDAKEKAASTEPPMPAAHVPSVEEAQALNERYKQEYAAKQAAERAAHAQLEPLPPLYGTKQVINAYEANEVAADLQFKGRRTRIVGIIRSIEKDLRGHPFVSVGSNRKRQVVCRFDDDSRDPATLKKGALALFECDGAGMGLVKSIHFEHCRMIDAGAIVDSYPNLLKRDRKDRNLIKLAGALEPETRD